MCNVRKFDTTIFFWLQIDFGNAEASTETINKWAQEATEGKIENIVTKRDFSPDLAMILANTIYFKGDWHSKFMESQTEKRAFYVSHYKVIDTPFMFQRGSCIAMNYIWEFKLYLDTVKMATARDAWNYCTQVK